MIRILFQAHDDRPDLEFVDVVNEHGESIRVGEWDDTSDPDGYRALCLPDLGVRSPSDREIRDHLQRERARDSYGSLS